MVSYADFITLLFAVFVTLYAMSQTDKHKVEELVASLKESFGYVKEGTSANKATLIETTDIRSIPAIKPQTIKPGSREKEEKSRQKKVHAETKDFQAIKSAIEAYLVQHGAQDKASVEITKRGLVVSLKEAGFFDSGSAEVKQSSYPLLTMVARSLYRYDNNIRVEGNTDNVPINSQLFKSNWELSTSRATNIVHYLVGSCGLQPGKISAVGYGEYHPAALNNSDEGKRKNRRVDIVLLTRDS